MARFVGLDVSQKLTSICVVDDAGRRLWRGQCRTGPKQIERAVRGHAGDDASIGIETGPMTPWLVHELRERGLNISAARCDCAWQSSRARFSSSKLPWLTKDCAKVFQPRTVNRRLAVFSSVG